MSIAPAEDSRFGSKRYQRGEREDDAAPPAARTRPAGRTRLFARPAKGVKCNVTGDF
jgi:hypothetical protein